MTKTWRVRIGCSYVHRGQDVRLLPGAVASDIPEEAAASLERAGAIEATASDEEERPADAASDSPAQDDSGGAIPIDVEGKE